MLKDIQPRLAEIGKIKIGKKAEVQRARSGREYRRPKSLDHFILTSNERDAAGDFKLFTGYMNIVGPECKELPILLLYDDIEKNFATFYAYYKGKTCFCRGDGEVGIKTDTKEKRKCPCDFRDNKNPESGRCKPRGILSVLLPFATELGGVFTFRTNSWNTVNQITSSLFMIQKITKGRLSMIPLYLTVQMKQVEIEEGKPMKVPVCNIIFKGITDRPVMEELADYGAPRLNAVSPPAIPGPQTTPGITPSPAAALPEPEEEPDDFEDADDEPSDEELCGAAIDPLPAGGDEPDAKDNFVDDDDYDCDDAFLPPATPRPSPPAEVEDPEKVQRSLISEIKRYAADKLTIENFDRLLFVIYKTTNINKLPREDLLSLKELLIKEPTKMILHLIKKATGYGIMEPKDLLQKIEEFKVRLEWNDDNMKDFTKDIINAVELKLVTKDELITVIEALEKEVRDSEEIPF